jgi:hypothetical protein
MVLAFVLATCGAWVILSAAAVPTPSNKNLLTLENEFNRLEVTLPNGVITRIRDKRAGIELIAEPRLADNFKVSLPLPGKYAWQATEGNYILGREQQLTSHTKGEDSLVLRWAGRMNGSAGQRHKLAVQMRITLVGDAIQFGLGIENGSKAEIGEVYYPIIGGLQGLGEPLPVRKETELVVPGLGEARRARIFETFANMSWLGVFGPEQFYSYPDTISMPWAELCSATLNRNVYFGAHDSVLRYKVLHLEMSPGIAPSRAGGNWPSAEELRGAAAGVKMCFVHMPYQPTGQRFEASPVVLRFHKGDWRDGARYYGAWFASTKDLKAPRNHWVYQTAGSAECGAVPFRELPDRARKAAAGRVKSLLLTDWKAGGQGNGVPNFTIEPKLGTREELCDALRQCHELGVKVSLLVNLGPVSQRSSTYTNLWSRYVCQDRWGIPYTVVGWPEASPVTGGLGAGERRVWVNPSNPDFRARLRDQVAELAGLGIDGVHWQDFFARPLDFNPMVGRTPDGASWEGGIETWHAIVKSARAINPVFAISTDSLWDGVLSETMVCSQEIRDQTPLRIAFPFWQGTFTLPDEDAMMAVNKAIAQRGRIQTVPAGVGATVQEYLNVIVRARETLSHTLLDGEIMADGIVSPESCSATIFRNVATGRRSIVVLNSEPAPVTVEIKDFRERPAGRIGVWVPTSGFTNASLPVRVELPARMLAILSEEEAVKQLGTIANWTPPSRNRRVIFDLASSEDLKGWKLEGSAFSVSSSPGLIPRATLNSYVVAGESATGTAASPVFDVPMGYEIMEVIFQGGWSETVNGKENLALQFVDADSGSVLEELTPPGIHVLTTKKLGTERLVGKRVFLRLSDGNTNASFAWIGLRSLTLEGKKE